mmetsp:Transcript_103713/g.314716  ORF Transcript_103713/g.314716 Transcript_103713/m.314716 type:complete len:213 (+) Transcript_103713:244-882(+)
MRQQVSPPWGRLLRQGQEPQGSPYGPLADALSGALEEASEAAAAGQQPPAPVEKEAGRYLNLQWELVDRLGNASVQILWDHGCEQGDQPKGECNFPLSDKKNPMWLVLNGTEAVEDTARLKLHILVLVMGVGTRVEVDCAICGEPCTIAPPSFKSFSVPMPDCPFAMGAKLPMPQLDFSQVPFFANFRMETTYGIARPSGEFVFQYKFEEHL